MKSELRSRARINRGCISRRFNLLKMTLIGVALALVLSACGADSNKEGSVSKVDPSQALSLIAESDSQVIDVRTPDEFREGHLANATNIDLNGPDFAAALRGLERSRTYVVYCASGNRSAQAASIMKAEGFTSVRDAGGYQALKAAGAKVVEP